MKRLLCALLLVLLATTLTFSQGSGYNSAQTTVFNTTTTGATIYQNSLIKYHQLIWTTSGTVSTCQVTLDTSPDGSTWTVGGAITAQTCTPTGSSLITGIVSSNYLRVNVSTLTGGGAITVVYEGWAYNPFGVPTTGTANQCLLSTSTPGNVVWGACSGSASANWSSIVPGTGTITAGTYNVGTGSTLTFTGTGVINANQINGLVFPALSSGQCLTNNGTTLSWGTCGGSAAFSGLTSGTNTTAAMLVGSGASLGPTGTGTVQANRVNEPPTYNTNDMAGSDLCAKITAALNSCPTGTTNTCHVVVQATTPGSADHCAAGTSDFWAGVTPLIVDMEVQAQVYLKATVNWPFTPHFVHGAGSNQTMLGAGFYMDTPFTTSTLFANNSATLLSGEGPSAFTGKAMNVLVSDGGRTSSTLTNQWQQNASGAHWQDIRISCNNQTNCIQYYTANEQEKSYYLNVALWDGATTCTTGGCNFSMGMFFDHYAAQTGNFGPSHFALENVGDNAFENTTGTSPNQTIYGIVYEANNCPPATCTVTGGSSTASGGNIRIIGGTERGVSATQLMVYGIWIDGSVNNIIGNVHCEWQSTNCLILGAGGNGTSSTTMFGISDVNNPVNAVNINAGTANVVSQSDNGITDAVNGCTVSANVDFYAEATQSGWWSNTYHYACVSAAAPIFVGSAPSGACTNGTNPQIVTSTGTMYTCQASVWGAITGSGFANPMTTLGDMIYENATPAPARLAGPTAPNSVPLVLTNTPSGGAAQTPAWLPAGITPNAQTGVSYTIAATDRAGYVSLSNAGAIAVTLPQAGTAGFANNFVFVACDIGAGTATITPTTSTISYSNGSAYTSGAANVALTTGQCINVYSDNTNYFAILRTGGGGGGTPCTITANSIQYNNAGAFGCTTVQDLANVMSNTTTTQAQVYQGGQNASANSALGGVTIQGADQTGAGGASSQGGGALLRGGNNAATNTASVGGNVEVASGQSTGASSTGLKGLMLIAQTYPQSGTVTQWDLVCFTGTAGAVTNCPGTPQNVAGVAVSLNGTVSVEVAQIGSEVPIAASAAVTVGNAVCAVGTASKVTDVGATSGCVNGVLIGHVEAVTGTYQNYPDGTALPTLSTTLPIVKLENTQPLAYANNANGSVNLSSASGFPIALEAGNGTVQFVNSNGANSMEENLSAGWSSGASFQDIITTGLKATAALTAGQVVKLDTANNESVVVATTADTGAGVPLSFVTNSPGIGTTAHLALPGSVIYTPILGTGTCATIGQFVIVDTTINGRIKCTSTFSAGTVLGRVIVPQSTVGSAVGVYVWPQ